MLYLISLNEITLFRFLGLILLGKNVKVLRIAPFMLMLKGIFTRLVEWAIRNGKTEYAVKLTPELQDHWDFERRFYFIEVFKKYEPWQDEYYEFNSARIESDQDYGYAYKKATCSYTFWKVIEIYILDAIINQNPAREFKVYGLLPDTKALGQNLLGSSFAENIEKLSYPRFIVNSIFICQAITFSLGWLLLRTRPTVRQSKVDIMFDTMKDGREYELFRELADAGKFVLIDRFPNNKTRKPNPDELDAITVLRADGLFTILAAIKSLKLVIADVFQIGNRYWSAPPALFFEMLTLPYKRLLVRGLLNRYHPDVFIGRDEYNVDHVVRRIELKNKGIKSFGLSNALCPCFSSLAPNVRYASYDIYYVNAVPLVEQYLDTWVPDMELRSIGGYSLPRETMTSTVGSRGENILFTMRVAWNMPEMVNMVRAVAKAFPHRTVYLQFKQGFVSEEQTQRLIKECGTGIPNFVFTTDNVYSLLDTAKYHISDISTFVAEAIRSGMVTFLADLIEMEFSCYRQFPNLCSKSADDLVKKLKDLEDGKTQYPHEEYFKLLGCEPGEISFDIIRQDLNLSLKKT